MVGNHIIHIQEVNSTNTYLKNLAAETQLEEGTVILADNQTEGKGRGDHKWVSPAGEGLTFSIYLRPALEASHHFCLNEFVSLSIIYMLKEYSIMAKIKWPNDIYVHNKKIAGILIENSLQGPTIVSSIIGIGMNINQIEFPDELPDAISLRQAMGKSFDLKALLDALLRDLGVYYSSLKNKDFESIHQEYNNHLFRKNEIITYSTKGKINRGRLHEVSAGGELVIQKESGEYNSFLFDELQMII